MLGVLLVLHGSKIPQWKEMAVGYASMLRESFPLVEYGFLEFDTPDLRSALESLVAKGAEEVVVVPLLFATGTHFLKDIPRLLGIEGENNTVLGKKINVRIAQPIGLDERVAEILKERVEGVIETSKPN
ncbi:CbiX/SirB N-terminal domain-containing protein [Sulfuracidifex metallicus]|uniref:CbiX/SirB N-terminal domain-containing protein n=1 Tax=Sulfuracidifex metallicus TaxID=47303 RepID=UPI0022754877|nr:CbiX/SirB N-terminal domain-containing protein [Sulfuracidifex metallicus]MCY0850541.1 sirohydrochlorin cobaltochelatase [Sulfuracidifex metallicus]